MTDVTSQQTPMSYTNKHIVDSVLQSGSNVANNTVRSNHEMVGKANTAANELSKTAVENSTKLIDNVANSGLNANQVTTEGGLIFANNAVHKGLDASSDITNNTFYMVEHSAKDSPKIANIMLERTTSFSNKVIKIQYK
ncbi:MAG: hypothetical protein AB8W37_08025 [Arsenophonus endosymbiont of Dermacentor nuttalli]